MNELLARTTSAAALSLIIAVGQTGAARDVTDYPNGAKLAIDRRTDSAVDAVTVAFAWWAGDIRVAPGEREVLGAAIEEICAQPASGGHSEECVFGCGVDADVIRLWGMGPAGSAERLSRVLVGALQTPVEAPIVSAAAARLGLAARAPQGPRAMVTGELARQLFAPVPISPHPDAVAQVAASLDAAGLERLRRGRFVGRRCGAGIVGSSAVEEAAEPIGSAIAKLPPGDPVAAADVPDVIPMGAAHVPYIGEVSWIGLGYRTPGIRHPDAAALLVIERIMGDGNGSLLFRRLRGELDLAYTVAATLELYGPAGRIAFWSGCRSRLGDQVLAEMQALVSGLSGKIEAEDLTRAIARARFELALVRHQPSVFASYLASSAALGLGTDHDRVLDRAIANVTAEDVQRVTLRWLRSPAVVVGDPRPVLTRQTSTLNVGGS